MNTTLRIASTSELPEGATSESLGQRVRRMRLARDWKLADLAERAGIATSTLSKVENERLTLSYDRLVQVAHGFDLSLSEFLADGDRSASQAGGPARASGRMCVEHVGDGRLVETENFRYDYLCTRIRQKSMTPMTAQVKASTLKEFGPLIHHEGEEFVYVLSGTIQLHTEFYSPETLEEGDSAYFDAAMGHGYTRVGDSPALILCLMTGEEEIPSS